MDAFCMNQLEDCLQHTCLVGYMLSPVTGKMHPIDILKLVFLPSPPKVQFRIFLNA